MTRRRPHALAPAILAAAVGGAGIAAGQPDGGESVDALRCWRRVDRGAVRIGERFAMTLTCRAVDAGRGRAVPDTIGLEPETIDAQPFEVLGGERSADVRDETGRTFQYRYALRLTGEDYFGRDVDLPPIAIGYRIERRADDGAVLAGRELTYVLPAEPIRVLSLVPDAADDIRGLPAGTLGEAEDRLLRANLMLLAAAAAGIGALGLLAAGVRRARRARRGAAGRAPRPVGAASIVRGVLGELTTLRRESLAAGWTPDRLQRALAALRLAAAVALRRPVAERAGGAGPEPQAGELRVRSGVLRGRTAVVSSALTPGLLADAAAGRAGRPGPAAPIGDFEPIRGALAAFSAARYARERDASADVLTGALDRGMAAIRPLRIRALAPIRRAAAAADAARGRWRRWTS